MSLLTSSASSTAAVYKITGISAVTGSSFNCLSTSFPEMFPSTRSRINKSGRVAFTVAKASFPFCRMSTWYCSSSRTRRIRCSKSLLSSTISICFPTILGSAHPLADCRRDFASSHIYYLFYDSEVCSVSRCQISTTHANWSPPSAE